MPQKFLSSKPNLSFSPANFMVVGGAYAFAFFVDDDDEAQDKSNQPEWLKFVYKSLDFGGGRERGARK